MASAAPTTDFACVGERDVRQRVDESSTHRAAIVLQEYGKPVGNAALDGLCRLSHTEALAESWNESIKRGDRMIRELLLVTFLALTGCAAGPAQRAQFTSFPIAQTMDAEVRLTQHQMQVSHANSTAGGAAGLQLATSPGVAAGGFATGAAAGLIGALVDVAIDAHRSSVAEDAAKPMREHMQGFDADEVIYASAESLDRRLFAEHLAVQRLEHSEDEDKNARTLQAGSSILVLAPSYSVSYDGKTFTYVLAAKLVDRGANRNGIVVSTPRYQRMLEYILAQDALPDGAQWSALDADQWRAILSEAANETVAMLNYDISANPGEAPRKAAYGHLPVSVDQTRGDRSWVRTRPGILLSVSSASLTKWR